MIMPKTAEEVNTGILSTIYKLDEAGVASLKEEDGSFKDDALDILTKLDADRVKSLKGDPEAVKREAYSRGKRETWEEVERTVKEKFGVSETDKKGMELVEEAVNAKIKSASGTDEEKVKASEQYRKLEKQLAELPKTWEEKLKARETEIRAEFEGEQNLRTVLDEAAVIFDAWEPVLPGDAAKAANQKRVFLDQLRSAKFQVTRKDGKVDILPMKPDGSGRLEDDHGHPISLKELVEHRASKLFEKRVAGDRNGAPDPNTVGGGSGGGSVKYPATMTKAEYFAAQDAATSLPTREERRAATEALAKVQVTG